MKDEDTFEVGIPWQAQTHTQIIVHRFSRDAALRSDSGFLICLGEHSVKEQL